MDECACILCDTTTRPVTVNTEDIEKKMCDLCGVNTVTNNTHQFRYTAYITLMQCGHTYCYQCYFKYVLRNKQHTDEHLTTHKDVIESDHEDENVREDRVKEIEDEYKCAFDDAFDPKTELEKDAL